MPNLNKVMLMGNLTRDPELRYLPSNVGVVTIGLAINRRWRNQQGENQEETTFVDCEAFGRQAEVLNQYLSKGRPLFIEGRLKLDQWQDKQGQNRSRLKVIIERFEFLDSRADGAQRGGGQNNNASQGQPQRGYQNQQQPAASGGWNGANNNNNSNDNNNNGANNSNDNNNNAPSTNGGDANYQAMDDDEIPF